MESESPTRLVYPFPSSVKANIWLFLEKRVSWEFLLVLQGHLSLKNLSRLAWGKHYNEKPVPTGQGKRMKLLLQS